MIVWIYSHPHMCIHECQGALQEFLMKQELIFHVGGDNEILVSKTKIMVEGMVEGSEHLISDDQPFDHVILFYPHTFSMPSPFSCSHYLTHIHILMTKFCNHCLSTMYILFILNYILHILTSTSHTATWISPSRMTIQLYVAIIIVIAA